MKLAEVTSDFAAERLSTVMGMARSGASHNAFGSSPTQWVSVICLPCATTGIRGSTRRSHCEEAFRETSSRIRHHENRHCKREGRNRKTTVATNRALLSGVSPMVGALKRGTSISPLRGRNGILHGESRFPSRVSSVMIKRSLGRNARRMRWWSSA